MTSSEPRSERRAEAPRGAVHPISQVKRQAPSSLPVEIFLQEPAEKT